MSFFVAICSLELGLYGVGSLKEKRGIVKRVVNRTRNRFGVAVSEVGALDRLDCAELGIAVVSNDKSLANSVVDRVVTFVEDLHLAEVRSAEYTIEAY
jgi:uncharacterized protein YlxP (DUF503 family)